MTLRQDEGGKLLGLGAELVVTCAVAREEVLEDTTVGGVGHDGCVLCIDVVEIANRRKEWSRRCERSMESKKGGNYEEGDRRRIWKARGKKCRQRASGASVPTRSNQPAASQGTGTGTKPSMCFFSQVQVPFD